MKQRLSDHLLPARVMRIGPHGKKHTVQDVQLIFIDKPKNVMRFRFVVM